MASSQRKVEAIVAQSRYAISPEVHVAVDRQRDLQAAVACQHNAFDGRKFESHRASTSVAHLSNIGGATAFRDKVLTHRQ